MTMLPFPDGSNPDTGMQLPDYMGGINDALRQNAALGRQRGGGLFGGGLKVGSPLRNFLGALGDALLVSNGMQPLYRQRLQQKRTNEALSGFLTDPDTAIAKLMEIDPSTAIELEMKRRQKSEMPSIVREAEWYAGAAPEQRSNLDRYLKLRFPGAMSPITLGPGDTIEYPGGGDDAPAPSGAGGDVPTVRSAAEAIANYPAGTTVRSPDGRRFKVPGGATGSQPSPTFP